MNARREHSASEPVFRPQRHDGAGVTTEEVDVVETGGLEAAVRGKPRCVSAISPSAFAIAGTMEKAVKSQPAAGPTKNAKNEITRASPARTAPKSITSKRPR